MLSVKKSEISWMWLFSDRKYEDWEIILSEGFVYVSFSDVILDQEIAKRTYYDGSMFRACKWLWKYVNHSKQFNCDVMFTKERIVLIARCTIYEWEEITIYYGDENSKDFTS